MAAPLDRTNPEMNRLLDKMRAHTLTLDEARTLHRWVDEAYLRSPQAPAETKPLAAWVKATLEALIVRQEHGLAGCC